MTHKAAIDALRRYVETDETARAIVREWDRDDLKDRLSSARYHQHWAKRFLEFSEQIGDGYFNMASRNYRRARELMGIE